MSSSGYKVIIKMNSDKQIQKRLGIQDDGEAVMFLRDDVYRLYEPYVPRDVGGLYRQVSYPNNHTINIMNHIHIIIIKAKKQKAHQDQKE